MEENTRAPRVLIRDLLIFQLKLGIDGAKDLFLAQLALGAAAADLALGRVTRGSLFYGLLRRSERFDLWLNLHGPARQANAAHDGLFGASPAGADTLLGKLEEFTLRRAEALKKAYVARNAARAA